MGAKLIEIVIMEGVATILFVLAWQIGVKGRLDLIAGYNERSAARVTDKAALGRLVARLCLLAGLASALMPLLTAIATGHPHGLAYCLGGYGGFILGVIGLMALQSRDYVR